MKNITEEVGEMGKSAELRCLEIRQGDRHDSQSGIAVPLFYFVFELSSPFAPSFIIFLRLASSTSSSSAISFPLFFLYPEEVV